MRDALRIRPLEPEESLFDFHPVPRFPVWLQASSVVPLFLGTIAACYAEYTRYGTSFGYAGPPAWLLFVPIAEELIFRGFVLTQFIRRVSNTRAILGSSALFGLWHVRNVFWREPEQVAGQVLYAAVLLGPLLGYLTLRFRTLWPGVVLHYLNNLGYFLRFL